MIELFKHHRPSELIECEALIFRVIIFYEYWKVVTICYIQNKFGFSFKRSFCVSHLQCLNDYYDYMFHNGGVHFLWEMRPQKNLDGMQGT